TEATIIGGYKTTGGEAKIYVDGDYTVTIDTYRSTSVNRQELFYTGLLPEGLHTIRIEIAGSKHESSANYYVEFDALQVVGKQLPELSQVTSGMVLAGSPILATSSQSGTLYLVPS